MRNFFFLLLICFYSLCQGQTLGGNAAYNFLKLSGSPLLTAAGDVNVSYKTNEVGFAINNPALLYPQISGQVAASFNNFFAGIAAYNLSGGYYHAKTNTTFAGGLLYVDYGNIPQTDASGNISGHFKPIDFSLQLSASRKYLNNWSYGLTAKVIHSSYQQYKSTAIAFDAGVLYVDSVQNLSASVVAKNMGVQLKYYAGQSEDLPFDLQVGITKKLQNAPLGFSFSAQQFHRFDITYNDSGFNDENGFTSSSSGFQKLFNHFVFASHIYLNSNLEATVGFNALRRSELSLSAGGNGLTGFSAGIRAKFRKLQILYARSQYQPQWGLNHFGITLHMDQIAPLNK